MCIVATDSRSVLAEDSGRLGQGRFQSQIAENSKDRTRDQSFPGLSEVVLDVLALCEIRCHCLRGISCRRVSIIVALVALQVHCFHLLNEAR